MSTTMTLSVPRLTGYARVQHVEVSLPRIDQLLEPPSRYGVAEPAARCWTPDRVKERLVEAFEIERRIPGGRVGPAVIRSSWPTNTRDSFSDRVHQGKTAREEVWRAWARAGGATPQEVTRMEQALAWPGSILANGRAFEGRHGRAFIVTRPMAPRASPRRSDSVACRWAEAAKVRQCVSRPMSRVPAPPWPAPSRRATLAAMPPRRLRRRLRHQFRQRIARMPVTISVSEPRYMGLTTRSADEPPIWGVIFELNREDGIGTAIGVTVRCDNEADAREQALSALQGFLSEASAAAEALTPSTGSPEPAENDVFSP